MASPRPTSGSGSYPCAVCCREGHDRRVLGCLHSFCASCIDQLELSGSEDGERKVACPLCRTSTQLPENGAAGLPKDPTQSADEDQQCETCKEKGEAQQPIAWCSTCKVALCTAHVGQHMLSGSGPSSHSIVGSLPKPGASPSCDDDPSLCAEHHAPLKYFCTACNVAVCGDCVAFGRHSDHRPIVTMKEVTAKLKEKVVTKADHLESVVLPRVEKTITCVDQVSADLSTCADNVRADISASADRAVNTIRACEQQKLQDVDDIEQVRHKALDRQKDDLQRHAEALKTAISFTKKVTKTDGGDSAGNLLLALDKRTTTLASVDFTEAPSHHPRILFEATNEPDVIPLAAQLIGVVNPCEACASESTIDGNRKATVQNGNPATFTVVAKDKQGKTMTRGGDMIRATWSHKPAEAGDLPAVEVTDNGNGRYDVTCRPPCIGEYILEVFVNSAKLSHTLSVTCHDGWFHFDGEHCQAGNTISSDKQTVTHTGQSHVYASVLGSRGLRQGRHSWKVEIQKGRYVFIGVAEKNKLADFNNYKQSYSLNGYDGHQWIMGSSSDPIGRFQQHDVIQVDLDCDSHTMQITNCRSGKTAEFKGLPASELFPYFATSSTDDALSVVW